MHTFMQTAPNTFAVGFFTPDIAATPKTPRKPPQFLPFIFVPSIVSAGILVNYLNGGSDGELARDILRNAAEPGGKSESQVDAEGALHVPNGDNLDALTDPPMTFAHDTDPRLDTRWQDTTLNVQGVDANGSPV